MSINWINDPREFPDSYPKEGIGYHYNVLCIQGIPRLMKRSSSSPNDFSWQFDLFIRDDRYPTQGIILINQHNTEDSDIQLTVMGRDRDLSLKQIEQSYEYVVGVLEGKIECTVPISEIKVIERRKPKPKKDSTTKSKKGSKEDFKSVEPTYLVGYE